jgi:hypothetical protein
MNLATKDDSGWFSDSELESEASKKYIFKFSITNAAKKQ